MQRFFDSNINVNIDESYVMSEEESKHTVRVLRMQEGDTIEIIDGKGTCYTATITEAHPKHCTVVITEKNTEIRSDHSIHIAVSPTKQLERMEWFIEKATEIGITRVSFIHCKNSERDRLKLDRLERKLISAVKQSKRIFAPVLDEMIGFKEFILKHPNGLIAYCGTGDKKDLATIFQPTNCPILIGPEGDFSEDEVNFALKNGYQLITFGENRLRTETAALYACMQAKLLI